MSDFLWAMRWAYLTLSVFEAFFLGVALGAVQWLLAAKALCFVLLTLVLARFHGWLSNEYRKREVR